MFNITVDTQHTLILLLLLFVYGVAGVAGGRESARDSELAAICTRCQASTVNVCGLSKQTMEIVDSIIIYIETSHLSINFASVRMEYKMEQEALPFHSLSVSAFPTPLIIVVGGRSVACARHISEHVESKEPREMSSHHTQQNYSADELCNINAESVLP